MAISYWPSFAKILRRFVGARIEACVGAVGATTKAVAYCLVLTMLAQGVLAGPGLLLWGTLAVTWVDDLIQPCAPAACA